MHPHPVTEQSVTGPHIQTLQVGSGQEVREEKLRAGRGGVSAWPGTSERSSDAEEKAFQAEAIARCKEPGASRAWHNPGTPVPPWVASTPKQNRG